MLRQSGLAFAFMFLFSITAPIAQGSETPVSPGPAWALVSFPCEIDADYLRSALIRDDLIAMGWTGSAYEQVSTLERGRGYFVNHLGQISSKQICAAAGRPGNTAYITLFPGWNLLGNPTAEEISFARFFQRNIFLVDAIYNWNGSTMPKLQQDSTMEPQKGYWIHSLYDINISIPIVQFLPERRISISTDPAIASPPPPACINSIKRSFNGAFLLIPKSDIRVNAIERTSSTTTPTDVTDVVAWTTSDPAVAIFDHGILHVLKTGSVTLTATYAGGVTASQNYVIWESNNPICLAFSNASASTLPFDFRLSLSALAYLPASMCGNSGKEPSFCTRDVTELTRWTISDSSLAYVQGNILSSRSREGTVSVTASYLNMQSAPLNITFKDFKDSHYQFLTINTAEGATFMDQCPVVNGNTGCYSLFTGTSARFVVNAQQTGNMHNYSRDVSYQARWTISDSSVAEFQDNVLVPKKPGFIWIQAHVGDASSPRNWIAILGDEPAEFLLIGPKYHHTYGESRKVEVGTEIVMFAVLYKYPGSQIGSKRFPHITSQDVSDQVDWIVADQSLASVGTSQTRENPLPGVRYLLALAPGTTSISARYKGFESINSLGLELWVPQDSPECAKGNISRDEWADSYSSATLETCALHTLGEPVPIRYQAYNNAYIIDTCVDLFITDKDNTIIRTLRNEGCTSETPARVLGRSLVFSNTATWDGRDESGKPMPPGNYNAVARFAILYDPVIKAPFSIMAD